MKIINIRFTKLRVGGFNAQNGSVSLEVGFNDGIEKQIVRTTIIDNPQALADSIINEIWRMEKRIHYEFDDNKVLQSQVNVVIEDEDDVSEKIAMFLADISKKVNVIMKSKLADGYMDKVKELNRAVFEF